MWRYLADSVAGTSHERAGTPCQDSNKVTSYAVNGVGYVVIACSDGAGSASHSDVGSRLACEAAVSEVCKYLDAKNDLSAVDRRIAISWLRSVNDRLNAEAVAYQVETRQLACTLLLAVLGIDSSIFVQIGDGALVTFESSEALSSFKAVFWPQNGEYANATNFLTDPRFHNCAEFKRLDVRHDGVAAFTDGLQSLALNYASRSAHAPFFEPFFAQLRDAPDPDDLHVPFRQFLRSEGVNGRTDDDKTLIIAVRGASGA